MNQTKIEKLKAIKEEFARTQARLAEVRKLEESAQPSGMANLLENDLEQAELVLAAQDMMHKLQNMAEDLAKMNAQDLFPLVDKMKAAFGQEGAHTFEAAAQEVLTQAMNTVRHAKDEMGNAILRLEGKMPANDMAAAAAPAPTDMEAGGPARQAGADLDSAMDDFGAADAAAGPDAEPLGRARKESREGGQALNESVILETAGQRLIETEGLDSLISWVLAEAAAGMPEEHFRTFATSVAQKAAKDPVKLAGWIGKKKHGMAAMAQLAEPTYTATGDVELVDEGKTYRKGEDDYEEKKEKDSARKNARRGKEEQVDEGKTFRRGDDADEDEDKKDRDVARKDARKRKNDEKVDEGKSFKANDEDDDNWSKKEKDVARKSARRNKEEKVDETVLAAHAVAQLIEASIEREGKGNAAKAVKEAVAYLAGKNLVEGDTDVEALVLEAFAAEFGMKPAAFSVKALREFMELSTQDKKNGNAALAKMSGAMGADKNAGTKSVQSAMAGMDGQERSAANKMLNKMKQDGNNPKNAGEFAAAASGMVGDDDTNESLGENINAAHWPVDTHGQYKGEPMSTDYGKLKPLSTPKAGKTEGGAPETKVEEPKVDGASAPEGGKPWEKKSEEPKSEEPTEEKVEEGIGGKLKKAALGAGAAAALASGGAAARTDPIGNIIKGKPAASSSEFDDAFGKGTVAKKGDKFDDAAAAAQSTADDVKRALRKR